MMNMLIKYLRSCAAVLLAIVLSFGMCFTTLSADSVPRVVKVAFPQIKGMTETSEDGTRHGLVVDYLNEIAKYTNWVYEYVDVDNGEAMLADFQAGEYELMGGNYYFPGLEEIYAYPDYNSGYSRSTLLARRNDASVRINDVESLNGKTIGVYANAAENVRRLKEFLSINKLDCTLKEYGYEQLSDDDDLYKYLDNGEVDLLLGNMTEENNSVKVVISYAAQPYYIVTNVGNQEILDGLNMALARIMDANPNFGTERYEANFRDFTMDIQLSEEEQDYVRAKGTVRVAVPDGWHPLFNMSVPETSHSGVVPDVLEKIRAFTGLEFSYVYADNFNDAIGMVQRGEADILGFYLDSEEASVQEGLALTSPYATMNNIVVRNKASTFPSDDLVGSIIEGRTLPRDVSAARVQTYADLPEAMAKVNRGEIDFVYGLSTRLEQTMQQYHFSNLVPVNLVNKSSSICFALARPVDPDLLTILNKAVNRLSQKEKSELLNRNMLSIGTSSFSLTELIYGNPLTFAGILTLVLLILVATVLLVSRARMKSAVMQSNLEKAEAESRAKSEFLSRMSHEIRTPMNAVVGLADLTAMMDGVPDNVRENLSKLRSSSQYLLSLINDILDISRIERGMLTITGEPFSMNQMLGDMKSMMEAEAGRRGILFSVEMHIVHSDLSGDAIRLRQVLTNLLSNAFKFTPAGGTVLLRAMEDRGDTENATFTFQVIDNGVGIKPEDQQRIFGSFEQVGSNSSKSQGTGLGLAISRNIVRLMGGELCLKSEFGQGSQFYFTVTLPVALPAEESFGRAENMELNETLDGIHILLAEDNDLNAEIAIQLLEMRGATVIRSENGQLAVEQFKQSTPGEFQVILMDVQMPVMNGLEATRAIRSLPREDSSVIPIVAMTANSFKEDVDAAKAAGMNAFVTKPVDVAYLYHALSEVLRESPQTGGSTASRTG